MQWPISAKAILARDGKVLLVENDRDEWELPGGHIEANETPEEALVRELDEETGLTCAIDGIVDAGFYNPLGEAAVLLLCYLVREKEISQSSAVVLSDEHQGVLWAPWEYLPDNLPQIYQRAISAAFDRKDQQRCSPSELTEQRLSRLQTLSGVEPVIGIGSADL